MKKQKLHSCRQGVLEIFKETDVFGYIEKGYGIFHCEGDEAVLEDIEEFLESKGGKV